MKLNLVKFTTLGMCALAALVSCNKDDENNNTNTSSSTVLEGTLTEDRTLAANSTYELNGEYCVASGVTLTIEEGVKIIAQDDNVVDYIIVEQGGKIDAQGTASNPIVMTSELKEHGAWGGLHVCGYAQTNVGVGSSEIGDKPYGGDNDSDNSGVMRYIRVEYAGYNFSEDKEANGFTFYGVGDGTTAEYLQAYKGSDDGFEWFGGSMNAKYLVSTDNYDDSFDWTYGFRGTIEYAVAEQISTECDRLIEGDNSSSNNYATPISSPTLRYLTLIGNEGGTKGVHIRVGSQATLENVLVMGKTYCLDLTSDATKDYFTSTAAALSNVYITSDVSDSVDGLPCEPASSTLYTNYAFSIGGYVGQINGAGAIADAASDWTLGWSVAE